MYLLCSTVIAELNLAFHFFYRLGIVVGVLILYTREADECIQHDFIQFHAFCWLKRIYQICTSNLDNNVVWLSIYLSATLFFWVVVHKDFRSFDAIKNMSDSEKMEEKRFYRAKKLYSIFLSMLEISINPGAYLGSNERFRIAIKYS